MLDYVLVAEFEETSKQINWISTAMDDLSYFDRIRILEPTYWLNDSAINAALSLLKKQFPRIAGLRNVNYFTIRAQNTNMGPETTEGGFLFLRTLRTREIFKSDIPRETRKQLQPFNINENHWVVMSTLHDEGTNVVHLYDSLGTIQDPNLKHYIAAALSTKESFIKIKWMKCQRQEDGSSCGYFAIANMVSLCFGDLPSRLKYFSGVS